ncbi:LacI family DNA-binding transcriptional regulator [Schaalia sp. 19OD2882]|uniref:LacI family DNA-binding transcriptional regulator n=1 Tax=Schaalia sp. 19OD2882 TaxID=2794089 RepID=UPI001C1EA897|nr:LacI family DNA-binding transcriptional regulator [Schaalia sp. 19OD2882]QWW19650.1 LacI family DNA-binding transcriptional regulator [Schaalia sp. 19OD2882]
MSSDERSRPRLVDVAREAGVSVSTASRALGRGSELIGATTRDHVRKVARRMGYQVNPIARSLRLATTDSIGMVVPSISNPFFMELVEQVEHHLAARGRNLLLTDSRTSVTTEDKQLRSFESGQVDGLLVVPCHQTYSMPAVERTSAVVPTVSLDRRVHGLDLPTVGVDDPHGMRTILDHLCERGARRIAMLANTGTELSSDVRVAATRSSAAELGMELADEDCMECSFSVQAGAAAVAGMLRRGRRPDAVVCLNDLLAIGAITQLRREGIAVPREVMVTGFDDIQFASLMRPSITTLRQPLGEIARIAVEALLGGNLDAGHTRVRGTLVVRESTLTQP